MHYNSRCGELQGGVKVKYLHSLWLSISQLYENLFLYPDWRNFLDIAIIAVIIYYLVSVLLRTRASGVFKGIGVFFICTWLSKILELSVIGWALQQFINTGVIVIVILFQPELRRTLEQIGRRSTLPHAAGKTKARSSDECVSAIVQAMTNMSRKRIGALIVLERKTGLREFEETGTLIDAEITAPLIENIFEPNTPLHDGATIIRNRRIQASACILQLSDDPTISKELGTRHRAAIGITETTDAISLIVSEETGIISMAREGKLTRYIDNKALAQILTEIFSSDKMSPAKKTYHLKKSGKATRNENSISES